MLYVQEVPAAGDGGVRQPSHLGAAAAGRVEQGAGREQFQAAPEHGGGAAAAYTAAAPDRETAS